jgi:hypothetical protein
MGEFKTLRHFAVRLRETAGNTYAVYALPQSAVGSTVSRRCGAAASSFSSASLLLLLLGYSCRSGEV